jgi:hypothetical protein
MPPNVDDGSIADDADLLRRIRPDQIVDDKNLGARRPSSAGIFAGAFYGGSRKRKISRSRS